MPASTYNLFDEPWIPVRWTHAAPLPHPERVGLRDLLLRSGDIATLTIADPPRTPHCCASCTRSPPG
ncbi:hypothetical protein SAV31267_101350 [Streptomyces avermitilis]|uniref:Uncharacterized protein n=1 Tax=Streptomyces avermitilis TaxID=33903 RepID=A0A4D4N894_STRAX|nr:hypothetical protein SAV31267_101350 [Streptomyces avermitilis]